MNGETAFEEIGAALGMAVEEVREVYGAAMSKIRLALVDGHDVTRHFPDGSEQAVFFATGLNELGRDFSGWLDDMAGADRPGHGPKLPE
jgi:hypothetical protein